MISKISKILEKRDLIKLQLILLLNFFTFFFEFLSLALIPLFVSFVFEVETVLNKFENYGISYFSKMDNDILVQYLGILIIFVFITKNVFYYFFVYIQGRFIADVKIKISKKLFSYYVTSPFSYHLENNPAKLTRNTTNSINGFSVYILRLIELLKEFLVILVIFLLLLLVNPLTTLSIFFTFSFFGIIYHKFIRPLYKNKAKINETYKVNLIQSVNETFGAIKDIKLLNKEDEMINYYHQFRYKLEQNLFHFFILERIPRLMLETLAIIIITLSALIFFNANYDLLTLLTVLSLIVVSLVRFLPAFNSIISSIFFIKIYQPSVDILLNEFEKIEELKKEKEKEKIKYQNKNFEKNLDTEKNLISLKNITFTYEGKKDFTLKNINFNIQRGNIIGVTGETGAGKSTLFHVMLGLLKPNSGTVYFNNKDINSNIENWRDQIGYIAQNIYLLDDTIEKNISFDFLNQKIDNKKIDFAIKISCLEKKISELPDGLKTRVGNDGLRLSGGEKQRVALARAIYRDPDIFFMDESTSALDSETEQKIIENLKQNFSNKTIILIAHRKSTINACDRIINIKDGIISDSKLDD
jgi:ATP-binding cassette, subfamily B, bacterial PglK